MLSCSAELARRVGWNQLTPVIRTYLKGAAAPLIVAICLLFIPDSWLARIQPFQALLGGTIALGAAVIGFSNMQEQIRAQRDADALKHKREDDLKLAQKLQERRNIAGALLGEVESILIVLRNRRVGEWYKDMLSHMQKTGSVNFGGSMSLSYDYVHVYKSLGTDIGKLEPGLAQRVAFFYGLLQLLFDRVKAAESGTYNAWDIGSASGMAQGIVDETREVEEVGRALAGALRDHIGGAAV